MKLINKLACLLLALTLTAAACIAEKQSIEDEFWEDDVPVVETLPGADVNAGYLASYGSKVNPFLCTDTDMVSIDALVYESLFELDGANKPQALLAESWTKDGKNWKITIRSGIICHNGIELVADDVVNSYSLIKRAGSANPYYGRLSLISEMSVESTFVINVKAKYSGMITLWALTFPVAQRDTSTSNTPMGTGPFWITRYTDTYIRLESNPLWWKQASSVQSINFIHYWDIGDELQALNSGEIDMMATRSATAAITKRLSHITSLDYTTLTYEMLLPNTSGILGDVGLRKAIMYAIDYNVLINNTYLDMAQQSEVPIFPGSWLYESRSAVYYYSPERALQYIYDSGWKDLTGDGKMNKLVSSVLQYIDIEIITYDEATSNIRGNAAEQIQRNLEALGMRVTVNELTRSEVRNRIKNGNYDLALIAVNLSEVPDMIPLFSEKGSLNFSGQHTEYMDEMLAGTVVAQSEDDMISAYSAIQLYITENLPVMGLCFRTGTLLSTMPLAGMSDTTVFDTYSGIEFLNQGY